MFIVSTLKGIMETSWTENASFVVTNTFFLSNDVDVDVVVLLLMLLLWLFTCIHTYMSHSTCFGKQSETTEPRGRGQRTLSYVRVEKCLRKYLIACENKIERNVGRRGSNHDQAVSWHKNDKRDVIWTRSLSFNGCCCCVEQ